VEEIPVASKGPEVVVDAIGDKVEGATGAAVVGDSVGGEVASVGAGVGATGGVDSVLPEVPVGAPVSVSVGVVDGTFELICVVGTDVACVVIDGVSVPRGNCAFCDSPTRSARTLPSKSPKYKSKPSGETENSPLRSGIHAVVVICEHDTLHRFTPEV